jgi:multidrug efflux pump subunit AcrA (membrane-fusion protein)
MKPYLLALAALALLAACKGPVQRSEKTQNPLSSALRVTVVSVPAGTLYSSLRVPVTLRPVLQSDVAARVGGVVRSVLAHAGDQVAAGQLVVALSNGSQQDAVQSASVNLQTAQVNLRKALDQRSSAQAQAQAQLQAAQLALQLSQQQAAQDRALYAQGGLAKLALMQQNSAVAQAEQSLQAARSALNQATAVQGQDLALLRLQVQAAQVQLHSAELSLRDTQVRAPFAGVISHVAVSQGEYLPAGGTAFTLADPSRLEARFDLPTAQAAKLSAQVPLTISGAGQSVPAKLLRNGRLPLSSGLVQLVAEPAGPLALPAGSVANLRFRLPQASGTLVPDSALQQVGGQTVAYTVRNGKAAAVPVEVLADNGSRSAVRGLPAGSQVIDPVSSQLSSGQPVQVVR